MTAEPETGVDCQGLNEKCHADLSGERQRPRDHFWTWGGSGRISFQPSAARTGRAAYESAQRHGSHHSGISRPTIYYSSRGLPRLGLNAGQTTLGAVAQLTGATIRK